MISIRNLSSLSFVLIALVLMICTDISHTKAISNERSDLYANIIRKRNSWWSKKSVDSLAGGVTEEIKDVLAETSECKRTEELLDCYIRQCVPALVLCGRTTRTDVMFERCKMQHRMCALRCASQPMITDL